MKIAVFEPQGVDRFDVYRGTFRSSAVPPEGAKIRVDHTSYVVRSVQWIFNQDDDTVVKLHVFRSED